MVPGDRPESAGTGAASGAGTGAGTGEQGELHESHWVRWHTAYEDPSSNLSLRLRAVQSMVRDALDEVSGRAGAGAEPGAAAQPGAAPESGAAAQPGATAAPSGATDPAPIRMLSLCAGQGRDVIDVVADHPSGSVSALLVELDPTLVARARSRAAELGVADRVRVVEGDASLASVWADAVPADVVLVCGIFGNISAADISRTIAVLPGMCAAGGHVVWTRHRVPPDRTPAIRAEFAAAGFTELAFEAPDGAILGVGHHRLQGATAPFDANQRLFQFVGDGGTPA
jgi:Putative methyltransferase